MTDIKTRVEDAKKTVTGNESLLDMLDADSATTLLNWGIGLAGQIAQSTSGMDDASAELNIEPRLKALRQFMRSAGNWAIGKYADPASRSQLKDKLLEQWNVMHGENAALPYAGEFENLLNQAGDGGRNVQQLLLNLQALLTELD